MQNFYVCQGSIQKWTSFLEESINVDKTQIHVWLGSCKLFFTHLLRGILQL